MYIEKERRIEIYNRYNNEDCGFNRMEDMDVNDESTESLLDWEDWHFIALADEMLQEVCVNGKLPESEIKWLQSQEDLNFDLVEEDMYADIWIVTKATELQKVEDKIFAEWFNKEYPQGVENIIDDSSIIETVAKGVELIDNEEELEKWRSDPETLKIYREVQEQYKDDKDVYDFLQICIDNGGGDPNSLYDGDLVELAREFMQDKRSRK